MTNVEKNLPSSIQEKPDDLTTRETQVAHAVRTEPMNVFVFLQEQMELLQTEIQKNGETLSDEKALEIRALFFNTLLTNKLCDWFSLDAANISKAEQVVHAEWSQIFRDIQLSKEIETQEFFLLMPHRDMLKVLVLIHLVDFPFKETPFVFVDVLATSENILSFIDKVVDKMVRHPNFSTNGQSFFKGNGEKLTQAELQEKVKHYIAEETLDFPDTLTFQEERSTPV